MRFGLKEKLLAVGVGVILTSGIVATAAINLNNTANVPAVESEEGNMETTSIVTQTSEEGNMETTSIDLSPIESAVSEGVGKINSATEDALEKIQSTAQETQKTVASESTVSTVPEPKTIPLNIVSETDVFKLTFESVKINYEYKSVNFKFVLSSTDTLMFDYARFKCTDKNGKVLQRGSIGGTIGWKGDRTEFVGNDCNMEFSGFDDPADIETVTITYAFEGYEPVTLTIDIPLETTE